jgi:polyribonucleotide nucleotidyltransferase
MATNNATNTPELISNGQLIIGSAGQNPSANTLTAGTGISITNGAGTITISSSGSAGWVDQTTATVTMAVNTGYTADAGASLITFTLPATSAIGDFVEINGKGSGLYTIAQASGQQIHFGNLASTSGAGGTVSSTLQFDCIRLRCITANTIWVVVSAVGNFTVV